MTDILFERYEQAIVDRDTFRKAQLSAEGERDRLRAQVLELQRELETTRVELVHARSEVCALTKAVTAVEQRLRAAEDERAKD